jgi:hypothetical protein
MGAMPIDKNALFRPSQDRMMNELHELLSVATTNIPREYCRPPIDGGGPIYLERI